MFRPQPVGESRAGPGLLCAGPSLWSSYAPSSLWVRPAPGALLVCPTAPERRGARGHARRRGRSTAAVLWAAGAEWEVGVHSRGARAGLGGRRCRSTLGNSVRNWHFFCLVSTSVPRYRHASGSVRQETRGRRAATGRGSPATGAAGAAVASPGVTRTQRSGPGRGWESGAHDRGGGVGPGGQHRDGGIWCGETSAGGSGVTLRPSASKKGE